MSLSPSAFVRVSLPACLAALALVLSPADPAVARPAGDLVAPPDVSVAIVKPGDTLETLLREMGLRDKLLVEVILGLSTEIDPERLQPGQRLEIRWSDRAKRRADRVTLTLGDEIIELDTSGVHRSEPNLAEADIEWSEHAIRVTVEGSVIATLAQAGAPTGIGLDLAAALGRLVDFRTEVQGGETVELLYRQEVVPGGEPTGRAELRYARLEIGGRTLEITSVGGAGTPVQVFENGESLRLSAAPVTGARISSHFGRRKHPILGTVRMHSGVDYAAAKGTPVFASAPGTVSYVGTRGGYGRVVEIRHGADMMTRYAHLSGFEDGLEAGRPVAAGDRIGEVGASGLATGPHLHYEVRYDGNPVDPLTDERIAALAGPAPGEPHDVLRDLRTLLARTLASEGRA